MGFLAAIPAALGGLFGGGAAAAGAGAAGTAAAGAGLGASTAAGLGAGLGSSLLEAGTAAPAIASAAAPAAAVAAPATGMLGGYLPSILTGMGTLSGNPIVKGILGAASTVAKGDALSLGKLFDVGTKLGGALMNAGGGQPKPQTTQPSLASPFPADNMVEEAVAPRPIPQGFNNYTPTALRLSGLMR